MAISPEFQAHLESGLTTLARCWAVERRDGVVFGFTDHDRDLAFEGITFRADTGLTARALEQTTGLAVDNSEALGILSDAAVKEEDIAAGRFDGAGVRAWLVNWQDVRQRVLLFAGSIGEIRRKGGGFEAELRGLAEALNQPQGRIYQKPCTAVLGDGDCRFDLATPGYRAEVAAEEAVAGETGGARIFRFADLSAFDERWFERGRLTVLSGAAEGLTALIKNDRLSNTGREIELWEALRAPVQPGDMLRMDAGCDKRAETCRLKFQNFLNFRGFPHIPGDDWLMSYPSRSGVNDGGSLQG